MNRFAKDPTVNIRKSSDLKHRTSNNIQPTRKVHKVTTIYSKEKLDDLKCSTFFDFCKCILVFVITNKIINWVVVLFLARFSSLLNCRSSLCMKKLLIYHSFYIHVYVILSTYKWAFRSLNQSILLNWNRKTISYKRFSQIIKLWKQYSRLILFTHQPPNSNRLMKSSSACG